MKNSEKNKTLKNIMTIIIPIIFFIIILIGINKYFSNYIEDNYKPGIGSIYSNEVKDKGISLLNETLKSNDILLMGSSELPVPVDQNPRNLFPNNISPKNLTITGAPHVQSLLNAIKLGALETNPNNNITIIISLQWFMTEEIDIDGFNSNFSELQYCKLMNNKKISTELKQRISGRVYELTKDSQLSSNVKVYSKLMKNDRLAGKVINPFIFLKEKGLYLKNSYESLPLINDHKDSNKKEILNLDFNQLEIVAEEQAKKLVTSNNFFTEDEYYEKNIAPNLETIKNMYQNVDLQNSKEFQDYLILLDLCSELGIKPYIVIVSTNGYYYDYTGLSKDKRYSYYDKAINMAKEHDFQVLDLKDYEYEKYFYYDVMHLGWKGWLKISEEMARYFK
ncbi:D-alanyl-lipoteichoic acid biosynthesis protein DltD [Miniphocaeibacter halophilus]|uniref:D-alanyl-lipoteichoic acid biosynthesis protein DltD n=1 Tax=Miniphocaeibacter halophilus TaxID=2931922 RepID=A0AC61MN57_9FIRM|nr:D-alanyl-lipoteichoic acid biosynthesis protein DltD [Miniphocaeibacter halophilus]QQK07030.1 D-alanyl-lipoteichoic acid biosynthesis protein DltD [Miniphocaeibacter halophilus]